MRLNASRAPVEEVLDIMSLIFVETCTQQVSVDLCRDLHTPAPARVTFEKPGCLMVHRGGMRLAEGIQSRKRGLEYV